MRNLNISFTLQNCLFGSVKLIKNADPDKYKYSGYRYLQNFYLQRKAWEKCHYLLELMHVDNKNNNTLILGEGATQGLDDSTLTGDAIYPINFT